MSKVSVIVPVYNVENYIEKMLESVQAQTFKDFEVILVNDGSTDRSQEIIDVFCTSDKRFKSFYQENGGVASARNKGIELASSDYIVFYDPDDSIPKNAVKYMYQSACKSKADIVVGIMRESNVGERRYNASTVKLSKKKDISKFDKELLWSFSVCNKMFRRGMIIENQILFPQLRHAEDAVFLLTSYFAAKKITGCSKCVYEYKFRPFWKEKSASQTITLPYLKDVVFAMDRLENLIKNKMDIKNCEHREFLDEFYSRYLEIGLFTKFYRQFWHMDEESRNFLETKVKEVHNKISPYRWRKICDKNIDLQIDKKIFTAASAVENAFFSFVVLPGIDEERFVLTMNSIYDQASPWFKVMLDKSYEGMVEKNKLYKENQVFVKSISPENITTRFAMLVDGSIIYSKNAIRMMLNEMLKDTTLDFSTIALRRYDGDKFVYTFQASAFTVMQCLRPGRSIYNKLDCAVGNKLLRASVLEKICNNPKVIDYSDFHVKKIYNACMIEIMDLRKIRASKKMILLKKRAVIKCKQKQAEDKLIDFVKRYFTKDDIKRFFKKFNSK